MIRANGSLLFLRSDEVVGIALSVDRTYFGGQLAWGEGVTDDWDARQLSFKPRVGSTHIRRQDDGRRWLVQIGDMEWLALHAQIHRLQRVQSHLQLWGLRCLLLRLRSSHVHLLELICDALHTLLTRSLVALLRRLVSCLWSAILWLTVRLLRLTIGWLLWLLHIRITVLRLLRHTIRRLLCLLLGVAICCWRRLPLARIRRAARLLPTKSGIRACTKLVCLPSVAVPLLLGLHRRRLLVGIVVAVCGTVLVLVRHFQTLEGFSGQAVDAGVDGTRAARLWWLLLARCAL